MKQFGDLGHLIELGAYYEPMPPDPDDYDFALQGDPLGINRLAFGEQFKLFLKQREDMKANRAKCINHAVSESRELG